MPKYQRYRQKQPNGKVVHTGITMRPEERDKEHQQRWPGSHLVRVGAPVTETQARDWESRQKKSITPERKRKTK